MFSTMSDRKRTGLKLALRKVLLPCQVVGQFPLIINDLEVKISNALISLSVFAIAFLLTSAEYVRQTIYNNLEPVLIVMNLLEYIPFILLHVVSLIWLSCNRAAAQHMLDSLMEVESSCKKEVNHRDINLYTTKMLITLLMVVVFGANRWYFVIKYANPNVHLALAVHFVRTLLFLPMLGQFVGFCCIISTSFLHLEAKLKEIIGIPGLETITRDYEKVALASADLQKMYSPQIVFLFAAVFVEINFSVYLSVVKPGHPDVLRIAFALWGLLYFLMGWWLIAAVDHIGKRADDFYMKYQAYIRCHGLHDYVPLNFPFHICGTEVRKSKSLTMLAVLMSIVVPAQWALVLYNMVFIRAVKKFFVWLIFWEYVPIILVLLIAPMWLRWHRGTLNEMLALLRYVESCCKRMMDLRDVSRYFIETFFTLFAMILFGCGRWFAVSNQAPTTWSLHISLGCHLCRSVLFCMVVGQFVGLCSLLSSTFRLLKFKMKEIVGIPGLETVARDYEKVALACQALEKLYSPQLLLINSAVFVEINFNLYLSFIVAYNAPYTIITAVWAGVFLWMSWWAVLAVERIKNQAEEFYIIYQHHIRRHGLRDYVPLNATLYIFALKRSEIKFSGFGLFTMDRKFLFSMCLATTTYVVMLKSLQ